MVDGILLDIAGVLEQDGAAIPGALAAVAHLRERYPLRFVTNTSRRCRADLCADLRGYGFALQDEEVFSAPIAMRHYLEERSLSPVLLVHPALQPDFAGLPGQGNPAVVLCDAGHEFNYSTLNRAFQVLEQGAPLLAVGDNRYFRASGELWLDAGPFVRALEYAADVEAIVLGKPAPAFFHAALADMGCSPANTLMIGDDVGADVLGARAAGLQACLVRTGKYQPRDEQRLGGSGASVFDDLQALVAARF